ncbi:MAG TPA: toll/interleukin-1 receptor domain-containing protein [Aggregatilineales bacterium]|nr:toll/interleukin-1 receptor domain-containing protein [Aggregatilineales bacterium]
MDSTVFIAYRRRVSGGIARVVYQNLSDQGIVAWMDTDLVTGMASETVILSQIDTSSHFLLILAPGTLDRCTEPGDWLRRDIEEAMTSQRQALLFMTPNFNPDDFNLLPEPMRHYLTGAQEIRATEDGFEAALQAVVAALSLPAAPAPAPVPGARATIPVPPAPTRATGEAEKIPPSGEATKKEAAIGATLEKSAAPSDEVFISYSRHDWDKYVSPLVEYLRQHGLKIWVDQSLLEGGDDWLDKVDEALDRCPCLVLCVSPEALTSRYVKMEYRSFFWDDKRIIPVICRDVPKLPPELRGLQYMTYSDLEGLARRLKKLEQQGFPKTND